jgi:ABC-type nitrate/sulfonate/bicarbonate transport system substrate-binding protein
MRAFRFMAVLALTFSVAGSAFAQNLQKIRIGVQSIPPDAVFMARDWLKPYGLEADISEFSSGGDMMQAFIAGKLDVADGGSGRLVSLAASQPDLFYIMAVRQSGGGRYGIMVPQASSVTQISQLKGKKIGVVSGSGSHSTFRLFLEKNAMAEKDFQTINMTGQDMQAALQQGLVDAAVAWEPQVAIAETAGVAKRIVSLAGVNLSPNFYLVSRRFADGNPEAVARFLAASHEEAEFIRNSPLEAGNLAAGFMKKKGVNADPKALGLALSRTDVSLEIKDGMIAELIPVAESMKAANKIRQMPNFTTLVNTRFYQDSVKYRTSSKK